MVFPVRFFLRGTERDTERIEAFSDGVFAIAITLLILDLKVPMLPPGGVGFIDLFKALVDLWPSYLVYVLSFVTIGIYWANHHYLFKLFRQTNHVLNLLNLLLLLWVCFIPFPTAVLGKFLLNHTNQATAVAFYVLGLLLPALSWFAMWLYASEHPSIIDERLTPRYIRQMTIQYIVSVIVYALAIALAVINYKLGFALCSALTLLYMLPPRTPEYKENSASLLRY